MDVEKVKSLHAVLTPEMLVAKGMRLMLRKTLLLCAGADIVANALAWLTLMTGLADPATLNPFKQLCVDEAAAGMDWNSSRYAEFAVGLANRNRCTST